MYNRYIGNTGQFYRVEEPEDITLAPPPLSPAPIPGTGEIPPPPGWEQVPATYPIPPAAPYEPPPPPVPEPPPQKSWWSRILGGEPDTTPPPPVPPPTEGGLGSKLDFGSILQMPAGFRQTVRGWLPDSLDLGDILLVLVLIYLFLEGEDDDMLIILGVLVVSWIWPLFRREDDE